MNDAEEKERSMHLQPFLDLESPFLNHEPFARQDETEWGAHLGALEGESPFLSDFDRPGDDAPSGEEFNYPELEDASDWEDGFEALGGISGDEDRTEVRDTTILPYRWICSIAYEAERHPPRGGTGVLISSRHVLTAAHVIRDKATAPANHSVYAYPGRYIGGEPFGRIPVARARVSSSLDFGLLTLQRPVDPAVQWWGHPASKSAWWSEDLIPLRELINSRIPLSTAGYPEAKDRQQRRMYASNATMSAPFSGQFRHTLDTTEGQSGSPIWTVRGDRYILMGIAVNYDRSGPSAVGVVPMVRSQVDRWMAEDAPKVRRRIALEVPYRWVCRLEIYDNDLRRSVGYGTGLMISDRHVLTSARVVHNFARNPRKYSIHVTPGYEFGKEALGSTTASKARVSPNFSPESNDTSADYGLLTLSKSLGNATHSSIGNAKLGSWGGQTHGISTSATDRSGKAARVAAFSRSSGGGGGYHKLRVSSGAIIGVQRGQILHKAGSKLDAPGAPIWVEESGRRMLVGLATSIFSKESDVNWGCCLTQETVSHLMHWINEDFEHSELEVTDDFSHDDIEERKDENELVEELVPFTLPAAVPQIPTDAAMRSQLQAMGTAEARALDAAFASFGDVDKFGKRLPTALNVVYEPLRGLRDKKHSVYVARLGAEAFIYSVPRLEGDKYYPWVDYPDLDYSSESPSLMAAFLHFAMRRLYQICRIAVRPDTHRRQIDRACALFRYFQTEFLREYRLVMLSEDLLLAYRTLLVQIIWLHYQRFLDGWLASAAKLRLADSVIGTEWENLLRAAAITQAHDALALVPAFNMTGTSYRDYFDQKADNDIAYLHYSSTPPPFTGRGPDMSFNTVLRRRAEQKALIVALRKESGRQPIPDMHNSASWQAWVDKPLLQREGKFELLKRMLDFVNRYFDAFTIHVPYDLREGCREKSYLTRTFPRAVTGALVHDCFVYACRWLHILGRLLKPEAAHEGFIKPRFYLIEMPAHVGVMIRADTHFNGPLLIGINNKDAVIHKTEANEPDNEAAEKVVRGMYRGMKVPYRVTSLKSNPADGNALWNEVCKLSEKQLRLPYDDPKDPPHLRYLRYNALIARAGREFTDAARASWALLLQSLERAKTGGRPVPIDLVRDEIRKHTARFNAARKSLSAALDRDIKPLIDEINADLDANQGRIPKGVGIDANSAPEIPLLEPLNQYSQMLQKAELSGELSGIDPELFFPENDFMAVVE